MSLDRAVNKITAVVVTGGSSGIGKAFIEQLYLINPQIRFCNLSRSEPALSGHKSLSIKHIQCDLSDPEAVARAFPEVDAFLEAAAQGGELLIINNAGFGCYGPAQNLESARQLQMLDLNIRALVDLTSRLLPRLLQTGGVILDIASTAAFQPTPQLSAYGATKAFVLHWNLALGNDLKGTKVRTLCCCPGPTATNFFKAAGFDDSPLANFGHTSEEVVKMTLRALAQRKRLVVCGSSNRLMTALGPRLLPKTWLTLVSGWVLRKVRQQKRAL